MTSLEQALDEATARLTAAGFYSPRADAELLAAHLRGGNRGQLRAAALTGAQVPDGFEELLARRLAGAPVQHLTGRAAFRTLELEVGPGVFVPRPETELLAQAVIDAGRRLPAPLVVDLCTGSGAIAASVAAELPSATVVAVELSPEACAYAERNLAPWPSARAVCADAAAPQTLAELDGTVDLITINPPYIPDGNPISNDAVADPPVALFGGPTGNELPLRLAERARGLLRPGGWFATEHHDDRQEELSAGLAALGFVELEPYCDLNARPRFLIGRKP